MSPISRPHAEPVQGASNARAAWAGLWLAGLMLAALLTSAGAWAQYSPDRPRTTRHPGIPLRNEAGAIIDPIRGLNAGDAYSPRQTCGQSKCHDYVRITKGTHFVPRAPLEVLSPAARAAMPYLRGTALVTPYCPPLAFGPRAPWGFDKDAAIGRTLWSWITEPREGESATCATFHPGGGRLELDRRGRRYDVTARENPKLTQSEDVDYKGAQWAERGVLEADCLLCHSGSYDHAARAKALKAGRLREAATLGGGFANLVLEATKTATATTAPIPPQEGAEPGAKPAETFTLRYNRRLFDEDGHLRLELERRPPERACLSCHGFDGLRTRGLTWHDPKNPDVHNQQGMRCVDCHTTDGLDHNMGASTRHSKAAGFPPTQSCKGCHEVGERGASIPKHSALPPSHLKKLACETCHINALHRASGEVLDTTSGQGRWRARGPRLGRHDTWYPTYRKETDGKLSPLAPVAVVFWGNRSASGDIDALWPDEAAEIWKRIEGTVKDDDRDGHPEINRDEEVRAGLLAAKAVLTAKGRLRDVNPVLARGQHVFHLDAAGAVVQTRDPSLRPGFVLHHNVGPAKKALGAQGCGDCHAREGTFFARLYAIDPFGPSGQPVTEPTYLTLGMNELSFSVFSVYWSLLRPWLSVLILAIFFISTLHFTRFGPHDFGGHQQFARPDDVQRIKRFTTFERILHLVVVICFLFLAFTGLAFSFDGWRWMELAFGEGVTPRLWHGWLGYVFGAGVVLMLFRWRKDALFRKHDIGWVKKAGGYLGSHDPVPAGRFNAGQKLYFWTVILGGLALTATGVVLYFPEEMGLNAVLIAAILHNFAGLFGVAGVLAHIYLSTAANPGTVQAIFAGWVTKGWARSHHPIWYEEVTGQKADDEEPPKAS